MYLGIRRDLPPDPFRIDTDQPFERPDISSRKPRAFASRADSRAFLRQTYDYGRKAQR